MTKCLPIFLNYLEGKKTQTKNTGKDNFQSNSVTVLQTIFVAFLHLYSFLGSIFIINMESQNSYFQGTLTDLTAIFLARGRNPSFLIKYQVMEYPVCTPNDLLHIQVLTKELFFFLTKLSRRDFWGHLYSLPTGLQGCTCIAPSVQHLQLGTQVALCKMNPLYG